MTETIMNQVKNLGIEVKGALSLEILADGNIKVYDMSISTFKRKLVAIYYKNINTTFRAESLGF